MSYYIKAVVHVATLEHSISSSIGSALIYMRYSCGETWIRCKVQLDVHTWHVFWTCLQRCIHWARTSWYYLLHHDNIVLWIRRCGNPRPRNCSPNSLLGRRMSLYLSHKRMAQQICVIATFLYFWFLALGGLSKLLTVSKFVTVLFFRGSTFQASSQASLRFRSRTESYFGTGAQYRTISHMLGTLGSNQDFVYSL